MPNFVGRLFRLHLQWPSLLEDRGKKAFELDFVIIERALGRSARTVCLQSEDKAVLDYAIEKVSSLETWSIVGGDLG